MSTKCQYQAAASNLKWWVWESCPLFMRIKLIDKKIDPIITCIPWKPVVIKNVVPNVLSEIVKEASKYSSSCRKEK